MSACHTPTGDGDLLESYPLDVRIVEVSGDDGERYRFEAPDHVGVTFDDPDTARLYADVYFDANGFVEEGTGERGIPPEVVQAGKDALAAYLRTVPGGDVRWVASFYGTKPEKVTQYCEWVRERAAEVRAELAGR